MESKDNFINETNSVFEQPWWFDTVSKNKWDVLTITDKDGNIIMRLPYEKKESFGIKYLRTPNLTQQAGPWIDLNKNSKNFSKITTTKKICDIIIKSFENKNVDISFHSSFTYIFPFIWNGYVVEPRLSYVINDLSDLDIVFKNMDNKLRTKIRKAEKNVDIIYNLPLEELIILLEKTFEKQNRKIPFEKNLIADIYNNALSRKAGICIGVNDKITGDILAASFLLYDENTCYNLLSGKNYNYNKIGVQELVLWESIKFASKHSKKFDFEGSMIPSIESFYRSFGGIPQTYYRIRKGSLIFNFWQYLRWKIKKIIGFK